MKARYYYLFLLGCWLINSTNSAFSRTLDNELIADIRAYCKYIEDKNDAKNSVLYAPDVILRAQNSTNDFPYQNNIITALSKDLMDFGKSKYVKELIVDECRYYQLKQQARLQIHYAISNIQRRALYFKLKKIQAVKARLSRILQQVQKKIDNQNETIVRWYQLDLSLQKLNELEREIQVSLAIQQPYKIQTLPLKQLSQRLWIAEKNRQTTLNKLTKLRNFSLQVQAGSQQSLSSISQNNATKPYAALFVRYNLAAPYSNYKTDQSLDHFTEWKASQVDGTQRNLNRLVQSIALLQSTEKTRLEQLSARYQKSADLTKKLTGLDSDNANHFKQQVESDQMIMEVEISYLEYLIQQLNGVV